MFVSMGLPNRYVEEYVGDFSLKPAKLIPVGLPAHQDIQNRGAMQSATDGRSTKSTDLGLCPRRIEPGMVLAIGKWLYCRLFFS